MFSRRRLSRLSIATSTQVLPDPIPLSSPDPSGDRDSSLHNFPPRYSNLSGLESYTDSPQEPEIARHPGSTDLDDGQSVISRESTLTATPTYASFSRSMYDFYSGFGESAVTLSNPPQYSFATPSSSDGEYVFHITRSGSKAQPWATLRLRDVYSARVGARGSKGRIPRFSGADKMTGAVELSLPSPQTISGVNLVLKATMLTGAFVETGNLKFLDHTFSLWERKDGDPRNPGGKFDGKLQGDHIFPFSIPFPTHVKLSTLSAAYMNGDGPATPTITRSPHTPDFITPFDLGHPPVKGGGHPEEHSTFPHGHISPFNLDAPEEGFSSPPASPTTSTITPFTSQTRTSPPSSPSSPKATSSKSRSRWSFVKISNPHNTEESTSGSQASTAAESSNKNDSDSIVSEKPEPLPLSFFERDVYASVRYELTLSITQGRFSSDSRVKTTVVYAPFTQPPPMPLIRHNSYQDGESLPGPSVDPDGWQKLAPVSIHGTFLDQREVDVDYTLYLANPLSYTQGTVIPCYLTIACTDENALHLLSQPRSPRVVLHRSVHFLDLKGPEPDSAQARGHDGIDIFPTSSCETLPYRTSLLPSKRARSVSELILQQQQQKSGAARPRSGFGDTGGGLGDVSENRGRGDEEGDGEDNVAAFGPGSSVEIGPGAVWWIPESSADDLASGKEGVRELQGEIHLPKTMRPTCRFPLFKIRYRVELLAPILEAFVPETLYPPVSPGGKGKGASKGGRGDGVRQQRNVYASQVVEIATDMREDEPIPLRMVGASAAL